MMRRAPRAAFPQESWLSGCRVFVAGTLVLAAAVSCSAPRFPVLQPVRRVDRQEIARAKAEEYFIMARDLERRGRHAEAERFYEMACDLDPHARVLRDQLARKYIESGKFVQAQLLIKGERNISELDAEEKRLVAGIYIKTGELRRAIETIERIDSLTAGDYYSLAIMYESAGELSRATANYLAFFDRTTPSAELGMKIVRLLITAGRTKYADSLLERLVAQLGESATLLDGKGMIALERGDTAEALAWFSRAIGMDSSFTESIRNAAQIYLQKSDYPGAIRHYEMLCNRSALYRQVYGRTLAVLYYYNRQFAASEMLLKQLLEANFDDADLHYYLGLSFAATGREHEARLQLEKTVVLDPGMDDAWRELCYLAIRQKKFDEALSQAMRFANRWPKKSASWRLLGNVLNVQKKHTKAIASFKKAILIDSADASLWFELASTYERNKQIDLAAATFRKVLALKPGDAAAANYLGYMWAEKGIKLDSAAAFLSMALQKEPHNGAFLDSYAWIWFQKGVVDSAYAYMTAAILRIDSDPVVFEHLGDILAAKGDRAGARAAYRKALEFKSDNESSVRLKIIDQMLFLERSRKKDVR